jgi:hypothetical protein
MLTHCSQHAEPANLLLARKTINSRFARSDKAGEALFNTPRREHATVAARIEDVVATAHDFFWPRYELFLVSLHWLLLCGRLRLEYPKSEDKGDRSCVLSDG